MTDQTIPLLDWSRFADGRDRDGFVQDLGRACRDTGFFLLQNHGIDAGLIDRVFATGDRFFALPEADKAPLDLRINQQNRGWSAFGAENLDDSNPDQVDRKEAFNVGLDLAPDDPRILNKEPFRGVNIWPDVPGFRDATLDYFSAVQTLSTELHRAIALDLGLDEHHFAKMIDQPLATLRLLRYPPATGKAGEIGAGAHTDYGSVTLLATDGEPGLQVRPRGGDWIDVPHVDGALIVNIADCLMRWTNDIYVSTPHRVLPPRNTRRSIVFFFDPNPDAIIHALPGTGTPKYPAVSGADYLRSRLDATYTPKEPA